MTPAPSSTLTEQTTGWLHGVLTYNSGGGDQEVNGTIGTCAEKGFTSSTFYTDLDDTSTFSLALMYLNANPVPYPTYLDTVLTLTLSPSMPCRLTYSKWAIDPSGIAPNTETVMTFDFSPTSPSTTITASGEWEYYNQFSLKRLF